MILNAKLATICYLTLLFVTPPMLVILWAAPEAGLPALFGMLIGSTAAVMINLWHQPKPGHMERRQRKSSNSTLVNLAEIIVLMLIAGAIWLVLQGAAYPSLLLSALAGVALVALRMMRRPLFG